MNIIGVFAAAFLLNVYLCILCILDSDSRCNVIKLEEKFKYMREKRRLYRILSENFGVKWEMIDDEFNSIPTYELLVQKNNYLESLIKQYNL